MDDIDKAILECLQEDATMPRAEVARRVNLSTTPCWRRIQKLKAQGVIRGEVALVDREKVNLGLTAFVTVRTNEHTPEWLEAFRVAVGEVPEIVACYRTSGDCDYMMQIVVPDVRAYDAVYTELIGKVQLHDVVTSFVMEDLKHSTALPLDYV